MGLTATALSIAALLLVHQCGRRSEYLSRRPALDRAIARLLVILVAAQAIQIVYFTGMSSWNVWYWYFYYVPVQMLLAGAVVGEWGRQRFASAGLAFSLVATTVAIGLVLQMGKWSFNEAMPNAGWQFHTATLARWAATNTPPNAIFAMGDRSGSFGYELERPLIPIEGLVGSSDFLSFMATGRIGDYLEGQDVSYIVRSTGGPPERRLPPVAPEVAPGSGCRSYLEPVQGMGPKSELVLCDEDRVYEATLADKSYLSVWRYHPERQPRR
jgi:hypothetical protein